MRCENHADSMCNRCTLPGKCCIGFDLDYAPLNRCETSEQVLDILGNVVTYNPGCVAMINPPADTEDNLRSSGNTDVRRGLPFQPLLRRSNGVWRFWCPVLDIKTGRCGDYENRPALCRNYEPGSDKLCAMHEPKKQNSPLIDSCHLSNDYQNRKKARLRSDG